MKKLNPIFLVLFLLTLVACGNADFQELNGGSNRSTEIVSPTEETDVAQIPAETDAPKQDVDAPQTAEGDSPKAEADAPHFPAAMVSLNYSRSLNYARITWSANYVQSAFIRVPLNYQAQNYIMLPITNKNSARGVTMKFKLPAKQNVFTVYYRDWANQLNKKEIKVPRSS